MLSKTETWEGAVIRTALSKNVTWTGVSAYFWLHRWWDHFTIIWENTNNVVQSKTLCWIAALLKRKINLRMFRLSTNSSCRQMFCSRVHEHYYMYKHTYTHAHTHTHRNTAGGRGSGCQGGGRWVGTKQTTLRAGSPYRKVGLEEGSVFGMCVWVCVWAHEHVRRWCRCNTMGPADFEKPQQSGVDHFFS